ncbi:DUF4129 domain-containing protein [Myceligenerans xiligouense]|uniref:DUF4129 domain-containing protein n=1 Tax=Myceligenerans xiligouense TaxID=253184 RepID=UPI0014773F5E|nr:DUF4129 domain-containing protein [Myceligenerans xiligouense]
MATVLVVLVVLAAAATTPWVVSPPDMAAILPSSPAEFPDVPPEPTAAATGVPSENVLDHTARNVIGVVATVLLLVLLAWLGTVLGRRLRDRYAPETDVPRQDPAGANAITVTPDELASQLRDAVQDALAHVDRAGGVPRDAVVAAWVALEGAAATRGAERDPAHTPTEFTTALLAATPAPAADIRTLRGLYQRARFTTRPVSDDDVAAARTALAGIARALDPAGRP